MTDLLALVADNDGDSWHHPLQEALVEVIELFWTC